MAVPESEITPTAPVPLPPTDVELAIVPTTAKQAATTRSSPPSYVVTFNEPRDADNPQDWPDRRKWAVTNVLSATGFNRILVSTIMAPALSVMAAELDMNTAEAVMALSIYLLATAIGPLLIGPLTEVYGRQTILHASNMWFLAANILCGFATSKGLFIAARFLAGFGASAVYALAGGVLGDVWTPEQRGKSLGWYLAVPVVAVAVGPILGGLITARAMWRWMFWSTSIFQAIMVVFCFTTFHETYAPVILKRRAERRRRETGNQQYQTLEERLHHQKSFMAVLGRAVTRPLRLLAFHPIIQVTSLISAFNYGILYIVLSSFADVWTTKYHLSIELSGLHYIACALGELVGSQVGGPLVDYLFRRMVARSADGQHVPEFRIPLIFPFAALAPLGLFVYGWTVQYGVHWMAVDIGIFVALFGMQVMSLPMQAYVMDAYADHTSSALAASQFLRSLTAFLFPLFAPNMYASLGYGWGNSTLAFAGLVFGFPAPLLLWRYGARMRSRAQSSY